MINEFDNQAVFPSPSGRFNPSNIDCCYQCEVHGDPMEGPIDVVNREKLLSPFGAHCSPLDIVTWY